VGGAINRISYYSKYANIIGGTSNSICFSNNSTILSGISNEIVSSTNSIIIGGKNLTLSGASDIVYVSELQLSTASNDNSLSTILVWDQSGSAKIKWRNASTLGGGGSTILPNNEIGFGNGSGITSSNLFTFDSTNKIFKSSYNSNITTDSYNSAILGGANNNIDYQSYASAIVGGYNNTNCQSQASVIIGGDCNNICNLSHRSTILGGFCNTIATASTNSSIVGGCSNTITGVSRNSSIIGGDNLILTNESNIVYVPKLKVASASNNNSLNKLLVWDDTSTNQVMYRDLNSISTPPVGAITYGGGELSEVATLVEKTPTLVALPEIPGQLTVQVYSSYTMSYGLTQTLYFNNTDINSNTTYKFFELIQQTNDTISQVGGKQFTMKNTIRLTGGITNEMRVDNISYTDAGSFQYWTLNTTVISGTTSSPFIPIDLGPVSISYVPTTSPTGSMVITSTDIPSSSTASGVFGEVRLGLSGYTPSLYVYTNQWYRFSGTTF
jgi:hypothetical protein